MNTTNTVYFIKEKPTVLAQLLQTDRTIDEVKKRSLAVLSRLEILLPPCLGLSSRKHNINIFLISNNKSNVFVFFYKEKIIKKYIKLLFCRY